MVDILTKNQRSYNMSLIRSEKTGPEVRLRDLLLSRNVSPFQMHAEGISGKPDFFFPDTNTAVFVDGCFWHGCAKCYQAPKSNKKFWNEKIERNIRRDKTVTAGLKKQGVGVLRIKEHELKKNPEKVADKIAEAVGVSDRLKVLDLFAGAGGFSEGFINSGCDMVAHVEMDENACDTIRTRMVYHALKRLGKSSEYKKYLLGKITMQELVEKYGLQNEYESVIQAKIGKDNYENLIETVQEKLEGHPLDIIIGGPPCQAYSHIGRGSDKKHMRRDPRKFLYEYYVEFLKALKPKVFVFENVPGLLSAGKGIYLRTMRAEMKKAGYETHFEILNAADYGVPQERRRVILMGWTRGSGFSSYPVFEEVKRKYKVGDFLDDLPSLKAGRGEAVQKYTKRSGLLKKLEIVNPEMNFLTDHIARPNTKRDLEIYKIAVKEKNKNKILKYNELPSKLKTHKNQVGFLDRFKVVSWDAPASHTVIAHISKDGHHYIHPDIKQNRSLTVREAARLQTFPDDFKFEGSRTAQYKQIGNAVPPMLSKIIADKIVSKLHHGKENDKKHKQ